MALRDEMITLAESHPDFREYLSLLPGQLDRAEYAELLTNIRKSAERWCALRCRAHPNIKVPTSPTLDTFREPLKQVPDLDDRDYSGELNIIQTVTNPSAHDQTARKKYEPTRPRVERAWQALRTLLSLGQTLSSGGPSARLARAGALLDDRPISIVPPDHADAWAARIRPVFDYLYPQAEPPAPGTPGITRIGYRLTLLSRRGPGPALWKLELAKTNNEYDPVLIHTLDLRIHEDPAAAQRDHERLQALAREQVFQFSPLGIEATTPTMTVLLRESAPGARPWLEEVDRLLDDHLDANERLIRQDALAAVLRAFSADLSKSASSLGERVHMVSRQEFLRETAHLLPPDFMIDARERRVTLRNDALDIADPIKRSPPAPEDGDETPLTGLDSVLHESERPTTRLAAIDVTDSVRCPIATSAFHCFVDGLLLRWTVPVAQADDVERALRQSAKGGQRFYLRFVLPDSDHLLQERDPEREQRVLPGDDLRRALGHAEEVRLVCRHHSLATGDLLFDRQRLSCTTAGSLQPAPDALDIARMELQLWAHVADRELLEASDVPTVLRAIERGLRPQAPLNSVLVTLITAIREGYRAASPTALPREQLAIAYVYALATHDHADELGPQALDVLRAVSSWWLTSPSESDAIPHIANNHGPTLASLWRLALADQNGEVDARTQAFLDQMGARSTLLGKPLTELQQVFSDACLAVPESGEDTHPCRARRHVVVTGPTSSGKSTIAEMFLVRAALMNDSRRCSLYIAPTKALAQAKHRELKSAFVKRSEEEHGLFDERRVVLSTADDNESDTDITHGHFDIACLVYEKANILFSRSDRALVKLGCIVVDELHMMANTDRGPNLELAITKVLREADTASEEFPKVVVISTEDSEGGHLASFLRTTTPSLFLTEPAKPIFLTSKVRPREVTHWLVLPPSTTNASFDLEKVRRFGSEASRTLTKDERQQIDESVYKLAHARAALMGRSGNAQDELAGRVVAFICEWLRQNPSGKRILGFIPGRRQLVQVAEQVANRRMAKPKERTESFDAALDELDPDDRVRYQKLAGCSVFVHHADMHRELRKAVERECSEPVPTTAPSQVLVATETLSYGVNLALDDVLIMGTDFPSTTRLKEAKLEPLTPSEFHNMVGRCGRLGPQAQRDAAVYVVVRSDVTPGRTVLNKYYSTVPSLESRLYVQEDAAAAMQIKKRRELGVEVSAATQYSYPFARAVLDALRHCNVQHQQGARIEDITELLHRTHFAESRLQEQRTAKDMFARSIEDVLRDAAEPGLKLVTHNGGLYLITERGEAIVDTGTEIQTIRPLLKTLEGIKAAWNELWPREPLPTYLYVLAVVAQYEVLRQFLRAAPEVAEGTRRAWTPGVKQATQDHIARGFRTSLTAAVRTQQDGDRVDRLAERLKDFLQQTEQVRRIPAYDGGGLYALIRFYNATVAWISGEPDQVVRDQVVLVQGLPRGRLAPQASPFSIRRFTEQLTWKVIFLARMLATGDEDNLLEGFSADAERSIHKLVLQLRFGCVPDAIPFFYTYQGKQVSRRMAHEWLAKGVTPSMVLTCSGQALADRLGHRVKTSQLDRISQATRRYARRGLDDLHKELTSSREPTASRELAVDLWNQLQAQWFRSSISTFFDAGRSADRIDAGLREVLSPRASDKDAESILRFRPRAAGWGLEWEIAPPTDGRQRPAIVTIAAMQTNVAGRFAIGETWEHLDTVLERLDGAARVVLVPFPWLPNLDRPEERPLGEILKRYAGVPGRRLTVCSPAALGTIAVMVARAFLRPESRVLPLLFGSETDTDEGRALDTGRMSRYGFRWVGVQEVLDALDNTGAELPERLRTPLMQHFEAVPD